MKMQKLKQRMNHLVVAFFALLASTTVSAGTTGDMFESFYNLVHGAATGYLGRGLAIAGGLVGLAYGAGQGRAMIAGVGIVLALFGVLGPEIVDAIFSSAVV